MASNKIMKICMDCDHLRIKLGAEGKTVRELVDESPKKKLFCRSRIQRIWCAKDMLTDGAGMPRDWVSQMGLLTADTVEGECPYHSPEEYDEEEDLDE